MTRRPNCTFVGGEKLSSSAGGPDAICAEIDRTIASHAPGVRYSVEIRALSPSRLMAALVVDGRTLPVQNFAVMDRNLNESAIRHFAQSLATAVAAGARSSQNPSAK